MDSRSFNGIEFRIFTLQPYRSFFQNFSLEAVEKSIMWGSVQVLPNQVGKKSFQTFEDIDLHKT